jgi:hypothetical protein
MSFVDNKYSGHHVVGIFVIIYKKKIQIVKSKSYILDNRFFLVQQFDLFFKLK